MKNASSQSGYLYRGYMLGLLVGQYRWNSLNVINWESTHAHFVLSTFIIWPIWPFWPVWPLCYPGSLRVLFYAARLAFLGHDLCICSSSRKVAWSLWHLLNCLRRSYIDFSSTLHPPHLDLTSTSPSPHIGVYGQVVWLTYWVLSGHRA
jgi:hypothetical protein